MTTSRDILFQDDTWQTTSFGNKEGLEKFEGEFIDLGLMDVTQYNSGMYCREGEFHNFVRLCNVK